MDSIDGANPINSLVAYVGLDSDQDEEVAEQHKSILWVRLTD